MSAPSTRIAALPPLVIGAFAPRDPLADVPGLIQDALYLRGLGADVVELDATDGAPFAGVEEDVVALLAAGLASEGVPTAVTTTRARLAAVAVGHGARAVIDPSGGTADPDMPRALAELETVVVIGPWSADGATPTDRIEDRYADGIVRNAAALLDAGVRSDRIRVHAGAGIGPADAERWRALDHLDRLGALGYPLLVSATEEILAATVADEADEDLLDDAQTAATALAVGVRAWAIRTRRVGRAEAAIQRLTVVPWAV